MEKVIKDLIAKLDKGNMQQTTTNNMVSMSLPKLPQKTTTPSFAMITARAPNTDNTTLPKRPPKPNPRTQPIFKNSTFPSEKKLGHQNPLKRRRHKKHATRSTKH
ncbi:hypothetical protein O181_027255 [Austropuccinia psidii MF-1]|uniref:Uncharacterized protein n=1 Tax=Austropuccinia psidii MF-1 TaxID=1389203 RepID=A0A9Q3H311_9BASI|nr:hypothetical protein [Austropuccinia psidii MF-1]